MSYDYCIPFILNIKDNNINFEEKFEEILHKGVIHKVFYAKLNSSHTNCPKCGSQNFIKNGFRKASRITLPKVSEFNTFLMLKKQRCLCKSCKITFIAETNIVKKNCFISRNTLLAVVSKLTNSISEKDVAKECNVSSNTVNRAMQNFYPEYISNKNYLPKVLLMDEFRSASGAMSFIFYDALEKNIIDVVEDRKVDNLIAYFNRYSPKARESVEHIVIDMYNPYIQLIQKCFPNAILSLDRFHLVQLISRSFTKTRVHIMNKYRTSNPSYYRKLKRYWKLLAKNSLELTDAKEYYVRSFGYKISSSEIVAYLLSKDEELHMAYDIYQDLLYGLNRRNYNFFKTKLSEYYSKANDLMKTSIKSYLKYLPYIKNSLEYDYSNGPLEGTINKIKTLKKVAYGYSSFVNFRNRILICSNLMKKTS